MDELELLHNIRSTWVNHAVLQLAHGSNLRENLRSQLSLFYTALEQAVESGDPEWLEPVISVWATSLTESDLKTGTSDLTIFIRELMQVTNQTCRDALDESQAIELILALTPIWGHIFQKITEFEVEVKVHYVTEQLARVQQALEKLDRSKSDFISVAAHELKTPLTLVDGYTAILNESLEQRQAATTAEYELINGISNGTRRLLGIINDMIDVSMIDNNLLSLTFQPVWINHILAMLENDASAAISERKQQLEIIPFPGSGEATFGDPERLMQVFRNLLSNAIKYTPDGGKITIYGRKLPGFIEICVQDTGIGISQDDQAVIFEKFSRLGNSALHSTGKIKFKGGGPGLGLHIARGIIEAHEGTIWVESSGHDETTCPGSTFHVFLPIRTAPPDDKSAKLFAHMLEK